eukprot:jgi/Bigna1/80371/fgenesh1_pg.70_\
MQKEDERGDDDIEVPFDVTSLSHYDSDLPMLEISHTSPSRSQSPQQLTDTLFQTAYLEATSLVENISRNMLSATSNTVPSNSSLSSPPLTMLSTSSSSTLNVPTLEPVISLPNPLHPKALTVTREGSIHKGDAAGSKSSSTCSIREQTPYSSSSQQKMRNPLSKFEIPASRQQGYRSIPEHKRLQMNSQQAMSDRALSVASPLRPNLRGAESLPPYLLPSEVDDKSHDADSHSSTINKIPAHQLHLEYIRNRNWNRRRRNSSPKDKSVLHSKKLQTMRHTKPLPVAHSSHSSSSISSSNTRCSGSTRIGFMSSAEEEVVLERGVQEYGEGRWLKILHKYKHVLRGRNSVDLKDKWRNIKRRRKKRERGQKSPVTITPASDTRFRSRDVPSSSTELSSTYLPEELETSISMTWDPQAAGEMAPNETKSSLESAPAPPSTMMSQADIAASYLDLDGPLIVGTHSSSLQEDGTQKE